jgi:hypothetical protein
MRIIQANVGRGSAAHDLLLSHKADIVLVQEPWTDMERQLTKTHPRYRLFGPVTRWNSRPRALTYVRRDLPAHLLPHPSSPDIIALKILGLTVINVYRAPRDLISPGSTLSTLLEFSPPRNTLVAGDFNTYHPTWQSGSHYSNGASRLTEWLDLHGLALCLEPDTPTHGANTIDLVFSDIPAETTVEEHLHTTSDHSTLLTLVDWHEPPPHPKIGSTDWEKVRSSLSLTLNTMPADLSIDDITERLIDAVQLSIHASSKVNTRGLLRTPWWTPELSEIQKQGDHILLWKAIARAKSTY